jgi:hypothetical protein
MAFASGAVSSYMMHNKHHENTHHEINHHHHHHSTTSDSINNNNINADSIHCPSTSIQHPEGSTELTNQTGAQMALNFIIKKVCTYLYYIW